MQAVWAAMEAVGREVESVLDEIVDELAGGPVPASREDTAAVATPRNSPPPAAAALDASSPSAATSLVILPDASESIEDHAADGFTMVFHSEAAATAPALTAPKSHSRTPSAGDFVMV